MNEQQLWHPVFFLTTESRRGEKRVIIWRREQEKQTFFCFPMDNRNRTLKDEICLGFGHTIFKFLTKPPRIVFLCKK